jgi:hypothetical protein
MNQLLNLLRIDPQSTSHLTGGVDNGVELRLILEFLEEGDEAEERRV